MVSYNKKNNSLLSKQLLIIQPLSRLILPFDFLIVGMFAHRLLTLGHIVATTKIPWKKAFGLGKKKQFNADKMLAKRGIEIMKEWQASYQVSL